MFVYQWNETVSRVRPINRTGYWIINITSTSRVTWNRLLIPIYFSISAQWVLIPILNSRTLTSRECYAHMSHNRVCLITGTYTLRMSQKSETWKLKMNAFVSLMDLLKSIYVYLIIGDQFLIFRLPLSFFGYLVFGICP